MVSSFAAERKFGSGLHCTACVGDPLFTVALHISTELYYSLTSHYIWGSLFLEVIKGWLTTLPHLFFETLKRWHTKLLAALCSYISVLQVFCWHVSIVFSDVLPDLHPKYSADKPSLIYWAFQNENCLIFLVVSLQLIFTQDLVYCWHSLRWLGIIVCEESYILHLCLPLCVGIYIWLKYYV